MSTGESCPVEHNPDGGSMPWLWAHNKPVLDELKSVVTPLTEALYDYVTNDVGREDGVARETTATPIQREFPYGAPYTLLPPRLFNDLDVDEGAPQLPKGELAARELIASYAYRVGPIQGLSEDGYTTTPNSHLGHILDDVLWMANNDIKIDPLKWEQYRRVAREQVHAGRYDMDIISAMRGNSVKSLYHYGPLAHLVHHHATGAFDRFMMMPTVALDVDGHSKGLAPVGYLCMPETAYGSQMSEKILRTTAYMVASAQQALVKPAERIGQTHSGVIAKHTTRGHEGRSPAATLISTVQEGARSSMEVMALLSADKVPGYDNPDELVDQIIKQGIIEQFTRAIPMGMIGPLLFTGKYFPGLLQSKSSGKLQLNSNVMQEIKQAKRAMARADMAAWATYWAASEDDRHAMTPPVATSLVCPAALPHGALTQSNYAFLQAYRAHKS
jgi:hypothetical protein